ncbi:MAG: hypothetical protein IAG13_36690 [Deltaproteobacteria bacterium]|nr:hypothetical protein [Nannocystaceae bacterium]
MQLPIRHAETSSQQGELAPLLDFVKHRAAHRETPDAAERACVESRLGQILWDLGAEHARPLVEAAIALLCVSERCEHGSVQPELDALRGWLERHPA